MALPSASKMDLADMLGCVCCLVFLKTAYGTFPSFFCLSFVLGRLALRVSARVAESLIEIILPVASGRQKGAKSQSLTCSFEFDQFGCVWAAEADLGKLSASCEHLRLPRLLGELLLLRTVSQ